MASIRGNQVASTDGNRVAPISGNFAVGGLIGVSGGPKGKPAELVDLGTQKSESDGEYSSELRVDLLKSKNWKWGPGLVRLYIEVPTSSKGDVSFDLEAELPSSKINIGEVSIPFKTGAEIKLTRYFTEEGNKM